MEFLGAKNYFLLEGWGGKA